MFNEMDLSGRQPVLDHGGSMHLDIFPKKEPFSLSHGWPLLPENLHELAEGLYNVVVIQCGPPWHIVGPEECQYNLLGSAGLDLGIDGARLAHWQKLFRLLLCLRCVERHSRLIHRDNIVHHCQRLLLPKSTGRSAPSPVSAPN